MIREHSLYDFNNFKAVETYFRKQYVNVLDEPEKMYILELLDAVFCICPLGQLLSVYIIYLC